MIAIPVVQQIEPPHDEVGQIGVAQGTLPEIERGLGRGAGRHRHVARHQRLPVDFVVGLVGAPQAAHLGAADVVGDEADHDRAGPVERRQRLGAQHDLVEAVAAHAGIEHAPPCDLLQLGRPGFGIGHLLAEGEGIAHGEDRRLAGPSLARSTKAVGIDRDARGGVGGARHMAEAGIVDMAAGVAFGMDRAGVAHEVGPIEQIDPGRRPQAQFEQDQPGHDGTENQGGTGGDKGAFGTLRVGLIHRSGML
ncbi:MAG: hypothetical protein HYZ40_02480 [Rhodospirillales bacterium]|nr:hypothetical protein [Rhodospirillales bacterium]